MLRDNFMVKTNLKRSFAIIGSALAPIVAIMYVIQGIQAIISIGGDLATNFFLTIAFFLFFGLAFALTFFGGKVLFSFLNKENDDEPFIVMVMCFTAFQFAFNLLCICFFGGTAANWVLLVFSLAASLLLLVHVLGIETAWYTDVIGVGIGMVTALTSACAGAGLMLAASIIFAIVCFLIMAIFALHLIKDSPKNDGDNDNESREYF